MIKILKASAGSGKTWNLARQYIKLMLQAQDPYAYRHILAVTFTNKATDEMKERILEKLHGLSVDPLKSDYYDHLVPDVCPDAASLKKAAGELLCNILHDYSAFAVSTIDRFFQQTLKAFAREIGHFSSYAIELDRKSLIRESVDRFLDSLTDAEEHSRSLEWMTRKTMSQLEEGDGYKLDKTLKSIAERFNSEEYRVALEDAGVDEVVLYSDERLNMLQERCDDIIISFNEAVTAAAAAVADAFRDAGLDMGDTSSGFMAKNIVKYSDGNPARSVQPPTDAFRKRGLDPSLWFSKKNKHMEGMVTEDMVSALQAFFNIFDSDYKLYNTSHTLKSQIYGFAVANDLYRNFNEILKERNLLTIDQTNNMLRKIIDGADAPFIYEKTGVRYEHFLLDEFQDTSKVQWSNFKPLLQNSVSQGFDNLIVGDVKQSVYRWRQSDWGLLEHQVQKAFPKVSKVESLDTNYRSCKGIVDFNNAYFEAAASYLDKKYGDTDVIERIYSDVEQIPDKAGEGMLEVSFCNAESLDRTVLDAVGRAFEAGYRPGDITILVRTNKEGIRIAEYLIENGVSVLSDESLKVSSSLTIRRLTSLLAGIENPEDRMASFLADSLGMELPGSYHSLVDLCETLLRGLRKADEDGFDTETLYIQSFMDIVHDHVVAHGNSLRAFLKKWAENESSISSPDSEDSVRIMTVHKAKGLDFPYVIFPSLGSVGFFTHDSRWSRPELEGTRLEDVAEGIYDVHLSSKSVNTYFENPYREEVLMQYVDNINILYVAFTRAAKAMSIISHVPEGVRLTEDGYEGDEMNFTDFAQWTFAFMASEGRKMGFAAEAEGDDGEVVFRKGEFPELSCAKEITEEKIDSRFVSYPLNPEPEDEGQDVRERGRLKFSADSLDFFSREEAGLSASNRIKGVVLHDVLADVVVPSDLEEAVLCAQMNGVVTSDEAPQLLSLLRERIDEVCGYGWFPDDPDRILNESELIDADGSVFRPDRVVIDGKKVIVIDYKFGEHRKSYERQVAGYADMWRRMGYEEVSAYLWYVHSGNVMRIL